MNEPVLTPEFVEREYNNRALVPDHAEYFAKWAAAAEQARRSVPCHLDLRYGPGRKETLDLFVPPNARGTVVFVHGGYWRALDKSDHSWIAPPFVAEGLAVAVTNYDLCPDVHIDRIVAEQRQAVAWLNANAGRYGASMRRVALTGHSAGGHLVAMLYATGWHAWNVDPRTIVGGTAVSGVFDLRPMKLFSFNADFRLDDEATERLSPLAFEPEVSAPLLVAVGALESSEFRRQSQLLWDRWPAVRPRESTGPMLVDGRHHFSVIDALAEPDHVLFRSTVDLFA
jgi:arylformamidase